MTKFAKNKSTEQVKTPPEHSAANNVETEMKPLGKAMKIGNMQNLPEQENLSALLTFIEILLRHQLGFHQPICLFRTVIETTCPTTRHQTTKLEKLDKQIGYIKGTQIHIQLIKTYSRYEL